MYYQIGIAILALSASLAHAADSPYSGQENRPIKALSGQDIMDYRNGRGMGTSLAAELNHYPGPRHVLDHAKALELSKEQQLKTQRLYDDMARDASRLGEQIVQKEAELEALFAAGKANQDNMHGVVKEIGALQAEYRFVHLRTHVAMREILSTQQIAEYDRLRGYAGTNPHGGGHRHGMMHGKTGHQ